MYLFSISSSSIPDDTFNFTIYYIYLLYLLYLLYIQLPLITFTFNYGKIDLSSKLGKL